MSEMAVVENVIGADGLRRVHVMAGVDLTPRPPSLGGRGSVENLDLTPRPRFEGLSATSSLGGGGNVAGIEIAEWAEVRAWEDEIRLHHLTATWRAREAVMLDFSLWGDGEREAVAWALEEGVRISEAAVEAALAFYAAFRYWPSAAWVRRWPKGLKEDEAFIPITEDCGMDLFAVEWAVEGFVVVGGGFHRRREEAG